MPRPPTRRLSAGAPTAAATSAAASGANTALQTLTTYIPTEVLTLYVSAIAAIGPLTIKIGTRDLQVGRWLPFWCFFASTPLIVLFILFIGIAVSSSSPLLADTGPLAYNGGPVMAWGVLASIKPAHAQLLILRASGFSYKELADALEAKATGIGTMLNRAEEEFRNRYLELHGHEEEL